MKRTKSRKHVSRCNLKRKYRERRNDNDGDDNENKRSGRDFIRRKKRRIIDYGGGGGGGLKFNQMRHPHINVIEEEEEELPVPKEEEIIEFPEEMSDIEDDMDDIENCYYCKLTKNKIGNLTINDLFIKNTEYVMADAIFFGDPVETAKSITEELNNDIIKVYNESVLEGYYFSSDTRRARLLDWQCLLKHFDHVKRPPFCYKKDLDKMQILIDGTMKYETYISRNDGPFERDERGRMKRKRVRHVNLDAVNTAFRMLKEKIVLKMKVFKDVNNTKKNSTTKSIYADRFSKSRSSRRR